MKRILSLCIVLSILTIQSNSFAQSLDHVLGEYLVKVNPDHNLRRIAADMQTFEGEATKLHVEKALKTPWNIWKVSFDYTKVHELRFLEALVAHPGIAIAQFNHLAEQRQTVPDDPQFDQQWHWLNANDADVDADLAWDITTGGLTTDGDEIVVAVLDDGIDLSHPDLADNLWINAEEIPDNGIDDDGNGYVDDYEGWSVPNNNDDVSGGDHGVFVAGMVGAVGNNGMGVTGMNWNVKLMIVQSISVQEDQVLEAYAYPYVMRQKYNQTAGSEGAFVVATNASWGVNFGDPEDAPLWCGFYDSLGEEGILNCGATTNIDLDVDMEGDLPTACPSEFMIGVTSTGSTNNQFGGYGPINIDIAAPGDQVFTTAPGGGYDMDSGTSFASPLVAGVIGLMYSVPCNTLISLAKSDPAAAALMMRDYLLNNVTPVASLEPLVGSGGLVNAHLAIQAIVTDCSPCPPPSGVKSDNLTADSADLSWEDGPNASQANLRWRVVGSGTWTDVNDVNSPYTLSGLSVCTEYEFQVMNECADSMAVSDFSNLQVFKTDGCCEPPAEIMVSDVTNATANASWTSVLAAASYNVEYRPEGAANWASQNTTELSLALMNLMPCTSYEAKVQTVCAGGELTDFTETVTFFVPGCIDCADAPYCVPMGSTQYEFVNSVTLNGYTNISGDNGSYLIHSDPVLLLEPLVDNFISVELGFASTAFTENVIAWIDYNLDYQFTEDEVILTGVSNEFVAGSFVVPVTAQTGATRMRVKSYFSGDGTDACQEEYEGELEDYCILINDGTFECGVPMNLDLSLNGTVATVTFESGVGADEYLVEYSLSGSNDWNSFITTETTYVLPAIDDCGDYIVQVSSLCSGVSSGASDTFAFIVPCLCPTPSGIDTLSTSFINMTIGWPSHPDHIAYEILWKESSSATWNSDASSTNTFFASPMAECTDYDFQVKAVCANDASGFTETFTFTSRCATGTEQLPAWANAMSAHPNPFSQAIQVEVALAESGIFDFVLRDVNGKIIKTSLNHRLQAGSNNITLDGLQALPQGVYFIQATSNDETGLIKMIKL